MVILIVDNSECRIQGLFVLQFNQLRQILSYEKQSYSYRQSYPKKSYLIDKKGFFPTGLLYLVESFLANNRIEYTNRDCRIVPKSLYNLFNADLPHFPHLEQFEAAKACVAYSRGIVSMPTGTGKSLVIALLIHELQVPTLVVVPSLELKTQLTKSLSEIFKQGMHAIKVENVDALDPSKVETGYDCVIIDEFHHSGAKTYRKLNKTAWSKIYYKIGFTATPFRSQDNERLLLESVLSKTIYKLNYKTAIDKGYIVPVEAFYIEVPKMAIKGNQKSWPAMYSELVVNNETRNILLHELLLRLHQNNLSTICLVKEISHGEKLCGDFPFMHGDSDTSRMDLLGFLLRETNVLVGTVGVLSEGIDTKPCEYIVIAGLGKSRNQFMQSVGRAVRNYPMKTSAKIILVYDPSHRWTKEHFKVQSKILLEEYGVSPAKINLD